MKRLIVVRGPMGAGKTTLCQVLLPYLQPAFWLDGDWCWKMEPFVADEAMREMVMENIAFLLGQFLQAEGKDNVLFPGFSMKMPFWRICSTGSLPFGFPSMCSIWNRGNRP